MQSEEQMGAGKYFEVLQNFKDECLFTYPLFGVGIFRNLVKSLKGNNHGISDSICHYFFLED